MHPHRSALFIGAAICTGLALLTAFFINLYAGLIGGATCFAVLFVWAWHAASRFPPAEARAKRIEVLLVVLSSMLSILVLLGGLSVVALLTAQH